MPEGRDEPTSVAALAVLISGLRRDLQSLTRQVAILTATQERHSAVLGEIAGLRREVEQIAGMLGDGDPQADGWFWLIMTEDQRAEHLAELTDWVDTVLRAQYPGYLRDTIRPCWPRHPEAIWELTWLYHLWCAAYLTRKPNPRASADWHDRWSPGVIRRLGEVMRRCAGGCQRQPGHAAGAADEPSTGPHDVHASTNTAS